MTKTDCVLMILNIEAFDIIVREKLKRETDEKGRFVHTSIPRLKENFGL